MGEAKKRGTYEQRKAVGEAQRAEDERRRNEAEAQRLASMTPEEKERAVTARMLMAQLAAMGVGHV